MTILGLGQTHNSTACLLVDGELVACASEERFTRVKNTTAFPRSAVDYVLAEAGVTPPELACVAHSYRHPIPGFAMANQRTATATTDTMKIARSAANRALARIPSLEPAFRRPFDIAYRALFPAYEQRFISRFASELGVEPSKVRAVDHHLCHAYAAYGGFFLTAETWDEPVLVFTLDAEGDGKCATISVAKEGQLAVKAVTLAGRSIGVLYGAVTEWLGMKLNEHEYKVMGLAPYAPREMAAEVEELLAPLIWVEGLTFRSSVPSGAFPFVLERLLRGRRFDAVAAGVQSLLEKRVVEWVRNAVARFAIDTVLLSGGVFMNVKANKAVAEMPEVAAVVVCPSASDESSPIGAAWNAYLRGRDGASAAAVRASSLYLGPAFGEAEIRQAIDDVDGRDRFEISPLPPEQEADQIAALLHQGNIVARMAGRMEFGARALGNRSILADPSRTELVRTLNEQIKGRDFWMPFACTIVVERADDYIVNPKRISSPYMMLAFDTTTAGRRLLKAGIHPYDFTIRPQLLSREENPRYHEIIRAFERLTGIGAVLNTSFNLHGEPIVCSPADALRTFDDSGLRYLQLENWLVAKRRAAA